MSDEQVPSFQAFITHVRQEAFGMKLHTRYEFLSLGLLYMYKTQNLMSSCQDLLLIPSNSDCRRTDISYFVLTVV